MSNDEKNPLEQFAEDIRSGAYSPDSPPVAEPELTPRYDWREKAKGVAKSTGLISFNLIALVLSVLFFWASCQEDPRAYLSGLTEENEVVEILPVEELAPEPKIIYKTKWKTKWKTRVEYRDRVKEVPVYKDRVLVRYKTLEELEPGYCYPDFERGVTYAIAPKNKHMICIVDYEKRTIRRQLLDLNAPILNSLR